jgi:hypothetical protein
MVNSKNQYEGEGKKYAIRQAGPYYLAVSAETQQVFKKIW